MTSYLGPDNPPPLSLISENYQRCLQVSKVIDVGNNLFDFGEEYYSKIVKLLRNQGELNIDDTVCIIASQKSKLPTELEKRLCLIKPVLHLTAGKYLYENSPGNEREINVALIPVNAEDYFNNEKIEKSFDKIIIADGLEIIEYRHQFLENCKFALKNSTDSGLIILHRTIDLLTLPVFLEVIKNFEKQQIDLQVLFQQLIDIDFLVGWNITSVPIEIPKTKWFNQLYNFFPPIMESIPTTNIYSGLREIIETSFKYSDFLVTLKDRFLFIVATISDIHGGQIYKMHSSDEESGTNTTSTPQTNINNIMRLKITQDIRDILPKNLGTVDKYLFDENKYPEEWWGTIPSVKMGQLDKSRINHIFDSKK